METNNHKISDYSAVLAEKYGAVDSPERNQFNEEAYAFYTGQILKDARKEAKMTQSELAMRINATKSYISRIENGHADIQLSTLFKIFQGLGRKISFTIM